jgi:hypothetical protein
MSGNYAPAVSIADAIKYKNHTDDCIKEVDAAIVRFMTMQRQLIAQKDYIEACATSALGDTVVPVLDKIVDYRVKLYKHRAFIGRLQSGDVIFNIIDDMHALPPADSNEIIAGYDRAIKSGGGLKVPIFNSSQILPGVTTSVDDPERIAETTDSTEVFNGVDIIGTKQFLIGVNAILTHPNNINQTLVTGGDVDQPYKLMDTASDLRKFNTGNVTNPYSAGAKHELSTGVLKGLLMQGNKNITGKASKDIIVAAIPNTGKDVDTSSTEPFKKIRGFGLN